MSNPCVTSQQEEGQIGFLSGRIKNFFGIIFVDIFFLGTELTAAYIEGKPIKIISSINISCFVILLILTIIRLIRKDYEISMYSALLLFGCSLSWVILVLLYGSIFGKNTGIITGILYVISIGIGILIPVIQGKVDRRKTFWVVIEKIAITATTIMVSVFCMIGISQNPNSEFNQKRKRNGRKSCS